MTAQEESRRSGPHGDVASAETRDVFRRETDRLEQLRKDHPDWNIWSVRCVQYPTTWHAQPSRYPLNAGEADELEEYIADDEQPPVEGMHTSGGC